MIISLDYLLLKKTFLLIYCTWLKLIVYLPKSGAVLKLPFQPSQLEKFYNENCEKFLLNAAYQEYLNNQKEDSDIEEIDNNFEIETIEQIISL